MAFGRKSLKEQLRDNGLTAVALLCPWALPYQRDGQHALSASKAKVPAKRQPGKTRILSFFSQASALTRLKWLVWYKHEKSGNLLGYILHLLFRLERNWTCSVPYIALIFCRSKFSRFSRIRCHSRNYFNENLTLRTIACFYSVFAKKFQRNIIVKNSKSRKFRPAKYKRYTVVFLAALNYRFPICYQLEPI